MVNKTVISEAIKKLNIENKPVCIHSSLKSFGYLEGGAQALIEAFLDSGCTVMVPAFTHAFDIFPPENLRPARNSSNYSSLKEEDYNKTRIYTTDCNDISIKDMGIVPYTLVNMDCRKRGYHPIHSFAAVGKLADILIKGQSPEDVYAPFRELRKYNGFILLMGVDLRRATIIHYAEQLAGRKLFIRWAYNLQGKPMAVSVGGCSRGFGNFENMVRPIEKTITVGESPWRCFSINELLDICTKAIIENPHITHCGNQNCVRCDDAVQGGPIW
ncbi:MAG TPA: AAC(3) family N-acetyltransferase [Clostridiaceae bacterium]|nr:AAC(3) family N-acetyltransferase [Clostridiaceae bacterium]